MTLLCLNFLLSSGRLHSTKGIKTPMLHSWMWLLRTLDELVAMWDYRAMFPHWATGYLNTYTISHSPWQSKAGRDS